MTRLPHRLSYPFAALAALAMVTAVTPVRSEDAPAQKPAAKEKIIVPESSKAKPGDRGKRAHTNYLIGNGGKPVTPPKPVGPDGSDN
jgi:hypothetical protein